jgi:hypothetical protein
MKRRFPDIYTNKPPRLLSRKLLTLIVLAFVAAIAGGVFTGYHVGLGDAEGKYIAYRVLP